MGRGALPFSSIFFRLKTRFPSVYLFEIKVADDVDQEDDWGEFASALGQPEGEWVRFGEDEEEEPLQGKDKAETEPVSRLTMAPSTVPPVSANGQRRIELGVKLDEEHRRQIQDAMSKVKMPHA